MKTKFLLFLLPIFGFAQITQIGADIDGEAGGDNSGTSVSISADGSIVAIGAPYNTGINGGFSGHVRIYQNIGETWTQIGVDIDGEAAIDWMGQSVSISDDGNIVAIGAPGESDNGLHGYVRIYQNMGGTWIQIGEDIDGEDSNDWFGGSTSLSADGSIVAIGGSNNNGNGNGSGHVRIYQNIGGTWTQIGEDIDGEAEADYSGGSVNLNANGSILAIGAQYNDGNGLNSGHVRVYQNTGNIWTQIGADIDGEAEHDHSGVSISLSANGNILAIGSRINDGNGTSSGHVRIYQIIGGIWIQIGTDIDGEAEQNWSGGSVSLSANGSTVAIGARLNDGNGSSSGHVRVFDLSSVLSINDKLNLDFSVYPNPTDGIIRFNFERTIKSVFVYDIFGKLILNLQDNSGIDSIDINELSKGSYFLKIIDEEENIETIKILKS